MPRNFKRKTSSPVSSNSWRVSAGLCAVAPKLSINDDILQSTPYYFTQKSRDKGMYRNLLLWKRKGGTGTLW